MDPRVALRRRRARRREIRSDIERAGRKEARRRWIARVDLDAIPMPAWAAERRIAGLTFTESAVWLPRRDAQFLARLDRECGGNPGYMETELRRCGVCGRPLLGEDAAYRRRLDESARTGRIKPCGSECPEASKDGRWRRGCAESENS